MKFLKKIFIVCFVALLSNFISVSAEYDNVATSNVDCQLVQIIANSIADGRSSDEIFRLIKMGGQNLSNVWFTLRSPENRRFTILGYAIYKNNVDLSKKLFYSELSETFEEAPKLLRTTPTTKLRIESRGIEKTELEEVAEMLQYDPNNQELYRRYIRSCVTPRTGLTFCKICGSLCPGGHCDCCDYDSSDEDWED